MPEESTIFNEKLKHTGFWNFKDLYNFTYMWLRDENYIVEENEYNEKIAGDAKEIVIKWKCWRKVSDYFKNVITVDWKILRMQDAEVEINGKKVKTQKGEVEFKISGRLQRDYEARWEINPFYKFFRGIYDKYVIKTSIDDYEDRLTGKCAELVDEIKSFLVLESKKGG